MNVSIEQKRQNHADLLLSTVAQAQGQLRARPLSAVTLVVDLLAGEVLPWLAAREAGQPSSVYLELSQSAEALTIIALRPSLRRAVASDLRLVTAQLEMLRILAGRLGEMEARSALEPGTSAEREAARQRLYFVAPPTRLSSPRAVATPTTHPA